MADNDDGADTILAAEDVAEILRVTRELVMTQARAGEIPMFKVGRFWRISATTLDDWMRQRETAYRRTPTRHGARR